MSLYTLGGRFGGSSGRWRAGLVDLFGSISPRLWPHTASIRPDFDITSCVTLRKRLNRPGSISSDRYTRAGELEGA